MKTTMKTQRIHTTKGGDKFLRVHMQNATPWMRDAYRPPAKPLPCDKSGALIVSLVTAACVLGVMTLASYIYR